MIDATFSFYYLEGLVDLALRLDYVWTPSIVK